MTAVTTAPSLSSPASSAAPGQSTAHDDGARTSAGTSSSLPVTFSGVGRSFPVDGGTRTVLRDVDLTVAPGEILAIVGASGCGKSTLLRAAAGLDQGFSGSVLIGEEPVRPHDHRTAMGFQEPRLMPWRTIHQNVALGLPSRTSRSAGAEQVDLLLELVGLSAAAGRRPREVSGGMAQRASLARALARRPGVLLLDEPFGALDALTRLKMQDLLLDIHAQTGTTVLLVTHDVDEALQLADRILLLGADPSDPDRPGATTRQVLTVPGSRPRDRGSAELAALRSSLLEGLGVDSHRH
ncbi:ABC transporter ATP-binding protein [Micrococcus terreus]|uniref:Sulfonate transport system ATP-binding protein n=1 Tax=Micrococcus terreus TaxID=574650 RepID=A0A1I7MNM9_9MICC|nr:ABC transporter ATP-binding protein [Micrococcus terreus]SFV23521.1 sulfonate transport system ATP-binding protein [Micrococcus terreus]